MLEFELAPRRRQGKDGLPFELQIINQRSHGIYCCTNCCFFPHRSVLQQAAAVVSSDRYR